MTLLERLEGSYLVQEQEAAEYIREVQEVLGTIKEIVQTGSKANIVELIDKVLEQKDVDQ